MNMSKNNTHRIRQTSRLFIYLLQCLMIVVPLINCAIWIFINNLPAPMQHELLPEYVRLPLPPLAMFLGWCISLFQIVIFLYANTILIRLFRLYEQGRIFASDNVRCFTLLSRALIVWCVVRILVDPLLSVSLTIHHPPGEHILALGLSSVDLTFLFVGGILAVISWVMEEARKINEEQELTI